MSSWSQALLAVIAAALFFAFVFSAGAATPALADDVSGSETSEHTAVDRAAPADRVLLAPIDDDPLDSNTSITIQLDADGDAYWQINASYQLTSESERDGFEQVASSFEADDDQDLGLAAYEIAAERVDDELDRTVAIDNVEQSATVQEHNASTNATGILSVEFRWTGFARTDGTELHIDDVLVAGGDRWFPGLAADQRLVIDVPDDYGVRSASVSPENGALTWDGPADFTDGELESTFVGDTNGNGDATPPTESETSLIPWLLIVVAIAVAVGFAYLARDNLRALIQGDDGSVSGPIAGGDEADETEPSSTPAVEIPEEPEEETDEVVNEELLSDEERVEYLLEQNGGRMKQADIVKETDWSNAKVSQLLSGMHEEGQIDKLRIGRENLISFPEESLTADDEK